MLKKVFMYSYNKMPRYLVRTKAKCYESYGVY